MSDRPPLVHVVPAVVLGCVVTAAWWAWARWQAIVEAVLTEAKPVRQFDRDRVRSRRRRRQGDALSTRRQNR